MTDFEVTIKNFVNQDALRGRFNVKDFVENICANLCQQKNTNYTIFDPKPFIRTFESTIDELLKLKRKVQRKIDDLEDLANSTEDSTRQKMLEINSTFESVHTGFASLETHIQKVGTTAVKIGEQLETIDSQRTRAVEAKDLIQYYQEFCSGNSSRLETLRKKSNESEYKAFIIAKRLNTIAKEVDVLGTEEARQNIERYCEELERNMLVLFDKALGSGEKTTMKQYAKTLFDFNGGNSCVQTYINQNTFFINTGALQFEHDFRPIFNNESSSGVPAPDTQLVVFYDEIRRVCRVEWETIHAVFPNSQFVMQRFVQRVQGLLESLLLQAEQDSPITYLQVLAASYTATYSLIKDLHKFDEEVISLQIGYPVLTNLLDRSFDDMFVLYTQGERYLNLESELFTSAFEYALAPFKKYVSTRLKNLQRKGIKTVVTAGLQMNSSLPTESPIPAGFSNMSHLLGSMMGQETRNEDKSMVTPDEMGVPSMETMISLIRPHIHAVNRCKVLVPVSNLPHSVSLICMLLFNCLPDYLEASILMAKEDFVESKTVEPDLKSLAAIKNVSDLLQMIQYHFQSCIVNNLVGSPSIHREIVVYKNNLMSSVEDHIGQLLYKIIKSIENWLQLVLSKQKKTDFKPKDDSFLTITTPPCIQACDFLSKMHTEVSKFLDGENLKFFISEIGLSFHAMLVDHFKKFYIGPTGGIIVLKDMARYQETIHQFQSSELNERFDLLREIGNLFMVKPENLKTVLNDGLLSFIETQLLYPYVILRSDWSTLKIFEREIFSRKVVAVKDSMDSDNE